MSFKTTISRKKNSFYIKRYFSDQKIFSTELENKYGVHNNQPSQAKGAQKPPEVGEAEEAEVQGQQGAKGVHHTRCWHHAQVSHQEALEEPAEQRWVVRKEEEEGAEEAEKTAGKFEQNGNWGRRKISE